MRSIPTPLAAALALVLATPLAAQAQERGRVISRTPVLMSVAVPREVCTDRTVAEAGQTSGAGALLGGIAGGAAGNAIGDGSGRAAATAIGIIGGALLGNKIEGGGQTQNRVVRHCSTQTVYEDRVSAFDVVYEYAGRQYSVRLAEDPGEFVELQLSPVGALPEAAPAPQYVPPRTTYPPSYTPQYAPQYVPQYVAPQYIAPPVTRIIVSPDYYHAPPPRIYYPPPAYRPRPDRDHRDDRRGDRREDRREDRRDDRRDDRASAGRDDRRDQPVPIGRPSSRPMHPGDRRQPGDFP